MTIYTRKDNGVTYTDFNSFRQAGMMMIGQMVRQIDRAKGNGRPITPAMLQEFQDTLAAYRTWWAAMEERPSPATVRAFKVVARPSPPS